MNKVVKVRARTLAILVRLVVFVEVYLVSEDLHEEQRVGKHKKKEEHREVANVL